jgi:hypothetical protein
MKRSVVSLLAVLCLAALGAAALADSGKPAPVQTRLKRVALFKNGFGFFVREATLTEDHRAALVGPFAVPSHGTFWVTAPSRSGFLGAVARKATGTEEIPARDLVELLRGNVDRTLTIWLSNDPDSILEGKLLAFAPDRPQWRPEPYAIGGGQPSDLIPPPGPGNFALIETDDGIVAINPYRIARIDFPEGKPSTAFPRPVERVELEASFSSPRAGDWLSVSYLAQGMTWAPSYLIDLTDPEQARLTAMALIINEAEDLVKTHVDLITGFPNLEFAQVASPISMKHNLAQFLQSLASGVSRVDLGSVVTQNVAFMRSAEMLGSSPVPDYGDAAAGQAAADLFFYPIESVTLGRGETGYYPLFSSSVPYSEFYEWTIPDAIGAEGRYRPAQQGQPEQPEIVWHSVRMTNQTTMPWTTAPAQLMKDGQIIGQDTLHYTAPTAETVVKITHAVGVKAEQTEIETNRERDAVSFYGSHFDRVTIEGTLRLTNFKDEVISIEITNTLSGDVSSTDPKAEDTALARGLKAMNPTHDLTWKLDLKPGKSREITYTYIALIRR